MVRSTELMNAGLCYTSFENDKPVVKFWGQRHIHIAERCMP